MHRNDDTPTAARIVPRFDETGRALRPVATPAAPPPDNGRGVHVTRHGDGWRVHRTNGEELGSYGDRSEAVAAAMAAAGWASPTRPRPVLLLDVPTDPRQRAALLREALPDLAGLLAEAEAGDRDAAAQEVLRLYAAELGGLAAALDGAA